MQWTALPKIQLWLFTIINYFIIYNKIGTSNRKQTEKVIKRHQSNAYFKKYLKCSMKINRTLLQSEDVIREVLVTLENFTSFHITLWAHIPRSYFFQRWQNTIIIADHNSAHVKYNRWFAATTWLLTWKHF